MSMNTPETQESMLEIPVWVQGKRKWVTGITKKTTFDDLIYALLVQAELLKPSDTDASSSSVIQGYAIAECLQLSMPSVPSNDANEPDVSLVTQRVLKGRSKVVKSSKTWQFDKFPLTVLHLISNSSSIESSTTSSKLRSKLFRRFLSSKSSPLTSHLSPSQSDSSIPSSTPSHDEVNHRKLLNHFQENLNILERQKRLLEYLDEKIQQAEQVSSTPAVSLTDVSRLFSVQPTQPEQLIFATQLCNSIFTIEERLEEKTNLLNTVEQSIASELDQVLHQQHYDVLPGCSSSSFHENPSPSNDLLSLKNSIYRSRELSRIQSKEMHDLDLSLRETETLLGSKYEALKQLEQKNNNINSISNHRTVSNSSVQSFPHHQNLDEQLAMSYDTFELLLPSMKETDEDSGINSLTSDDGQQHHHHRPKSNGQLETLV